MSKENTNKAHGWRKMEKGKFTRREIGGLGPSGERSDVVRPSQAGVLGAKACDPASGITGEDAQKPQAVQYRRCRG